MPLVIGIDEAGYGPLLGPLISAATVWRVAESQVHADWWHELRACISRGTTCTESRLPIADSKLVYDRKRGVATLERTILACAHRIGLRFDTVGSLLASLGATCAAAGQIPWYHDLNRALPVDPARSAFEGAASRLRSSMHEREIVCCGLLAEVLTEDRFNERLAATKNKALVLYDVVLHLMHRAAGLAQAGEAIIIHADRLGGRSDYRNGLMAAFPGRQLHVLECSAQRSRYHLAGPPSGWHVEFVVEGERHHLCVALASMLAKYVRELLMERFNAYWCSLAPALQPTAGYYKDARRFLYDIQPLVAAGCLPFERFVRAR